MGWGCFYVDESLMEAKELEESYNKLPAETKTILTIREGEIEIGGFKQFLSRYGNKRLRYQKTEEDRQRAETAFLTIFIDNGWLIKQIKDIKENITKLSQLDDWTSVSKSKTDTTSSNRLSHNQTTSTKDTMEDSKITKSLEVDSDRNSSGVITIGEGREAGLLKFPQCEANASFTDKKISYPVNSVLGHSLDEGSKSSTDTVSMESLNTNTEDKLNTSTEREYGNKGEVLEHYLTIRLPELRHEFWGKFNNLFLF